LWHLTCNILYNLVWKAPCSGLQQNKAAVVVRVVSQGRLDWAVQATRESSESLRPTAEIPGGWGWQMAAIRPVLSNTLPHRFHPILQKRVKVPGDIKVSSRQWLMSFVKSNTLKTRNVLRKRQVCKSTQNSFLAFLYYIKKVFFLNNYLM